MHPNDGGVVQLSQMKNGLQLYGRAREEVGEWPNPNDVYIILFGLVGAQYEVFFILGEVKAGMITIFEVLYF